MIDHPFSSRSIRTALNRLCGLLWKAEIIDTLEIDQQHKQLKAVMAIVDPGSQFEPMKHRRLGE